MATSTWNNRGREADYPSEIPSSGWKDTLSRVKDGFTDDKVSLLSAAMSYYALFALIPAITALVLVYAWISDPAQITQQLSMTSEFIPEEMRAILENQLTTLSGETSGIGFGAIFTVLLALWGASKGTKSMIESLNIIYDQEDDRGFFKQNAVSLGLTLLGLVLAIVAIGVIVILPAVINLVDLGSTLSSVLPFISWAVLLALFTFYLSVLYQYGPNRTTPKWRWVSWGSVIASVLFLIVSGLFSWYANEFGNFNKTYGSLGAIIVLMTWFYLSSLVMLLGAEINAELEHQTKKDSTKGQEKPFGSRGATMADTIGKTREKD